jgi:hypothetical protein
VHYTPRPNYQSAWKNGREQEHESNSEEEDEDDVYGDPIEVKTRSRSSSIVSSHSRPNLNYLDRDSRPTSCNSNRERVTIASIAPTILKTSSYSHTNSPATSSISLSNPRFRGAIYCRPHENDILRSVSDDEEEAEDDGEVPLLWVPPVGSGYEREFPVADLDETTGYSEPGGRGRDAQGRDGRSWIVTPPQGEIVNESEDSPDDRQGRFARHGSDGKRRGRGPRSTKFNGSLSPAEVPSSNTDSSESRSRSRNRTNLLPPRSSSRSRSRSSSTEYRSDNSGRLVSPDGVERRSPTERGRPLVRKSDSDNDLRGDKMGRGGHGYHTRGGAGGGSGMQGQRAHTGAPPSVASRWNGINDGNDKVSANSSAGSSSSSGTTTTAPPTNSPGIPASNPGTLSGIRGYIGSIWS